MKLTLVARFAIAVNSAFIFGAAHAAMDCKDPVTTLEIGQCLEEDYQREDVKLNKIIESY